MIKVPPSSLGFKRVFVVPWHYIFRTKNKRVSNPCFCLRFRSWIVEDNFGLVFQVLMEPIEGSLYI